MPPHARRRIWSLGIDRRAPLCGAVVGIVALWLAIPKLASRYHERRLEAMNEPALQAWTAGHPDDALAYFYLAMAQGRSGRSREAAEQLAEALELDPRLLRARWRLARLLAAAGQESQAKGLLRDGLRLDPKSPQLHAELGRLYENRQQFRPAAAEWEKAVLLSPSDANSWYHLGVCSMGVSDEARAEQAYRRATELAPTSCTYRKALGGVLRLERRYGEAESNYRRALALDSHDPDAYFGLAKLLADRDGATAEAVQNMRRAVALDPRSPLLCYSLADLHRQRGDLPAAVNGYQAALRLLEAREPPAATAWALREQWLARIEGPHFHLARLLKQMGRSAAAARHLDRFQRISGYRNRVNQLIVQISNRPDDAALHFDLARLHAAAGASRLAAEQYSVGLQAHPDPRAQAELRALRGGGQ